ncbi:unnamed protein product [Caretta caretta]
METKQENGVAPTTPAKFYAQKNSQVQRESLNCALALTERRRFCFTGRGRAEARGSKDWQLPEHTPNSSRCESIP